MLFWQFSCLTFLVASSIIPCPHNTSFNVCYEMYQREVSSTSRSASSTWHSLNEAGSLPLHQLVVQLANYLRFFSSSMLFNEVKVGNWLVEYRLHLQIIHVSATLSILYNSSTRLNSKMVTIGSDIKQKLCVPNFQT
jgi:hypothetical protein